MSNVLGAGFSLTGIGPDNLIDMGISFTTTITNQAPNTDLYVNNVGQANLIITGYSLQTTVGPDQSFIFNNISFPITIAPGANVFVGTLTINSLGVLTTTSGAVFGTITFQSNAITGIQTFTCTCYISSSSDIYGQTWFTDSLGQSTLRNWNFGSVVPGNISTSHVATLYNPSSTSYTVYFIPDTGAGYSIVGISSSTIAAHGTITFSIRLNVPVKALGWNQDSNAVQVQFLTTGVIQSTLTTSINCSYNAGSITPVGALVGGSRQLLMSIATDTYTMVPSGTGCETFTYFSRQYDFKMPDIVKGLARVLVRYEPQPTTCQLTLTISSDLENVSPLSQTVTLVAMATPSPNQLAQVYFDLQMSGSIITLLWEVLSLQGPLSLVSFTPFIDAGGEIIEATSVGG